MIGMINCCKNCLYCNIEKKDRYYSPTGEITYGYGLKTYCCSKDMLIKEPEHLCDKWQHKWWICRLIEKIRMILWD